MTDAPQTRPDRRITAFTGSAMGADPVYADAVAELAKTLAVERVGLVFGGGKVGLMGHLADAVLLAGGEVTGVIPQLLVDGETAHRGLTHLEIVADMSERKRRMGELGDAFIALPGGPGTLEEFFEAWTWQNLGIHTKPVALYDVAGFWQPLLTMIDHMVEVGFLAQQYRDALIVARTPRDLLDAWAVWQAPPPKWQRTGA